MWFVVNQLENDRRTGNVSKEKNFPIDCPTILRFKWPFDTLVLLHVMYFALFHVKKDIDSV